MRYVKYFIQFKIIITFLELKYRKEINVRLKFTVIALISIILVIGYAVFCTWQGGPFAGGVKFGYPCIINVSFKCIR